MRATRVFSPPCSVITRYSYQSGPNKNNEACALIYFVPSQPGVSMIFAKFFTKRKKSDAGEEGEVRDAWREDSSSSSKKKKKTPAFLRPKRGGSLFSRLLSSLISKVLDSSLAHVLGQSLADQDVLIMHGIYKRMMALAAANGSSSASNSNSGFSSSSTSPSSSSSSSPLGETSSSSSSSSSSSRWKSSYWLATQADTGVRAFHDWVERHGGGGPWGTDLGAGLSSSASLKPLPKEELLNHWERHTKHCSTCLAALERLRKVQRVVAVVGVVVGAAAAAAGVVAAALVVSSSSSSSSGSVAAAAASVSSPQLLTLASLAQVGLPCAVTALLLALTWTSLSAWERRFYRADKLADEK